MKLIFVYNANSGLLNAIKDSFHKTFFPKSYPCSLCALTYGSVSEKIIWKKFHQQLDAEIEFLHVDEFESKYLRKEAYPIVLKKEVGLTPVITSLELNEINNVEALIKKIKILI